MNYEELIAKARNGRSVNALAKALGIAQSTLNRFARGDAMPDYETTLLLAKEAHISAATALTVVAKEDATRRGIMEKVKSVFRKPLNATNRGRRSIA